MKSFSFSILFFAAIFSANISQAQKAMKETIKVWGNCGMCKTKIEKAARSAGATTANWSEETHQLKVSYASNKTSSVKIQDAIAAAGYDTQDKTADNAVYDKLHGCCKYERKEITAAVKTTAEEPGACKPGCKKEGAKCAEMTAGTKGKSCCKM